MSLYKTIDKSIGSMPNVKTEKHTPTTTMAVIL